MAIKIPLLTEFDPKGLREANAAFSKLSSDVGSLGRNFAVLGAGIVAGTALLGNAVMSASNFEAEFEGVNQVFQDAAGSVQDFADQASRTAGLSATEALKAAKTFGLFATGAGLGVDAAADFSTTMVQLAGDLGSFNDVPTADALAAIQSGLMGQAEPLRQFGVFLDDARLKSALLNATGVEVTGTLDSQQKMMASYYAILEQTTLQQGDFVTYQDTLGNSLKTITTDFENLTTEIGMMLLPAITAAMPEIKAMADSIGIQLKEAIESIDWAALIGALVDTVTFFVQNAEAIGIVIGALFALNTIYKTVVVVTGIVNAANAIATWYFAQLTLGVSAGTIALKAFRSALITTGVGAVLVALGFLAEGMMNAGAATEQTTISLGDFGGTVGMTADQLERLARATARMPSIVMPSMPSVSGGASRAAAAAREAEAAAARAAAEAQRVAQEVAEANRRAAEEAARALAEIERQAQEERDRAAAAEQAILDKRERSYESFASSVKNLFGQIKDSIMSSFDLPKLGNSVNSITRNISKLLERTKNFARNISQLSGLGLNSALLQQVIQAGPMAGSQLAAALISGGSSFIGQINKAYGEFGELSGGIAMTGTTGAFAGQQTINNYSIEVTGGVATGADVGRAVVNAIRDFERTSGAAWRA
jgi:hypothetical protein